MLMRPTHRYQPHAALWAGTPAWSPADLFSGGETGVWYDISDLSTLFVERTGAAATTPASVDGVVGTVRDKSGGTLHWIAPSDAARPILRQSGDLYYLEFDGVDDEIGVASATGVMGASMDVFIGVRFTGATGGIFTFHSGAVYAGVFISGSSSTTLRASAGTPTYYKDGTLFSGTTRGNLFTTFATNTEIVTEMRALDMTTNWTTIRFGDAGASLECASRLYGYIALTDAQTTDNRNLLRTWIGAKAGLTL